MPFSPFSILHNIHKNIDPYILYFKYIANIVKKRLTCRKLRGVGAYK